MDKNIRKQVDNPRQNANFLSVIFFKWIFSTYAKGYKRELDLSDLPSALDEHNSCTLGNKLSRLWEEELIRCKKSKKKSEPSLFWVLVKCFGCDVIMFGLIMAVLELIIKVSQPIFLIKLLRYFNDTSKIPQIEAFYWGTGIVVGVFLECIIVHPSYYGLQHVGMKLRVACNSLIYRKILKVYNTASESETNIGQMINLLSNDVNRLDYSVLCLHYLWIAPLQIILITYLLYQEVQLAVAGGILILLSFVPLQGCYGKLASYLTLKLASATDKRLRITNEIVSGVKVIKMYAWEKPFSYLVDKARKKEIQIIRNSSVVTQIFLSFESYISRVALFVTILVYVLMGNDVNALKVYYVASFYNILRVSLCRDLSFCIKISAEALVSVRRIKKFLLIEEVLQKSNFSYCEVPDRSAILLKSCYAKWNSESKLETLKNINLNVKSGSLIAVIGQVGAGKTSLLLSILNEIPNLQGEIKVNGKIAYASQQPWIFASSVRQNILFGKPMDKERYEKVIEVCQLKRDFELFPYGDSTLVGEKGINLSGGQCARINLARAVYHDADIYLLDDPLSAVDTHVGKGIFEDCIENFLKNKTVVLVTHQLHFLKNIRKIVLIGDGVINAEGTYNELSDSGLDLAKMMQLDNVINEDSNNIQTQVKDYNVLSESLKMNEAEEEEEAERRALGNVSFTTYLEYFKATGSNCLVLMVFIISIASQISLSASDYFVSYWTNLEEIKTNFTVIDDDILRGRGFYIYIYGSLTILSIFITLISNYTFFEMYMRISRKLHAKMFYSIIRTKMSFFNTNPLGRIINRFSQDIGTVDVDIPQIVTWVVVIGLSLFAVIGIVFSINIWSIIPAAFVTVIAYFFRIFYIKTNRSMKRLEGIARSPVFNHLSNSVTGLTTIRALKAQDILTKEFDNHLNLHSSAWFLFFSGSKAFGMYIELLYALFTGVVVYTLLSLSDVALAGDVGLVITQCMMLNGMLQWGVQQTAEIENKMTSVERILEYSKLVEEPLLMKIVDNKVPENWPLKGQIDFKNVSLTYNNQENPTLKKLNFTVESNEKVGIVGRTGAGKSSITNALFRLADLEGEIFVDDIATSTIALQELRSNISIIPQEPVLFAGTLRSNLDPFGNYNDEDLWQALDNVELKGSIDSDLGLDMAVAESGSNFSVGQRQLLCLARAIVRKNKILVLDEATANVDLQTDELIQKTVRKKFKNCTVLIIAHRLNTIMDCDKILVMDSGQVMEFDHPYNLLRRQDGIFCNMVQQTGTGMADNLLKIAKLSYEKRKENKGIE